MRDILAKRHIDRYGTANNTKAYTERMKKASHVPRAQKTQPGLEYPMHPKPEPLTTPGPNIPRLSGKVVLITGGDSGIGRAIALACAREGADIAVVYLNEHKDAEETKRLVASCNQKCILIAGDVGNESFAKKSINATVKQLGKLDCLVNNAGEQHDQESIAGISKAQLERTFRTNIFAFFFMVQAALPHLKKGSTIINTASVVAYRGSDHLIDYAATKGAVVSFTRSLAKSLSAQGIRVNAVAPGAVWTPLITASFSKGKIQQFGKNNLMKRAAEPGEIAPSYVFLASNDSSFMTGQVLHPNGGEIVNG